MNHEAKAAWAVGIAFALIIVFGAWLLTSICADARAYHDLQSAGCCPCADKALPVLDPIPVPGPVLD